MKFPVVLHTDDGIRYGVTVPDISGCFSTGGTLDDALENVKEAIDLHLEGVVEDGQDVPVPRTITEHRANPDFTDGVWAVVDIDVSRFDGRAEKVNITVPRRLLVKIDSYAKAHGATRSGFLVEAARRMMDHRP